MQLDDRPRKHLEGIEQGNRGERIGGRIDDNAAAAVDRLVHAIDQLRLAVGLAELYSLIAGFGSAHLLDVSERGGAVDVRLARAEAVEVGSVKHIDRLGHGYRSLRVRWAAQPLHPLRLSRRSPDPHPGNGVVLQGPVRFRQRSVLPADRYTMLPLRGTDSDVDRVAGTTCI